MLNKAKDSIEVNAVDDTDKTALHHAARRRFVFEKSMDERLTLAEPSFFLVGSFGNAKIGVIQVKYMYVYINMMAIAGDFEPFFVSLNVSLSPLFRNTR